MSGTGDARAAGPTAPGGGTGKDETGRPIVTSRGFPEWGPGGAPRAVRGRGLRIPVVSSVPAPVPCHRRTGVVPWPGPGRC